MNQTGSRSFGYSIVAATFAVQAIAIGLTIAAYPIFMDAIEAEFAISRTTASLGIPSVLVVGALLAPWIGRLIDRGAVRAVMLTGAGLMLLGYGGIALTSDFTLAAGLWIGVVGTGHMMLGPLPAMTVVANWFVERRGRMIAIAAMGTTLGGALAPPICDALIDSLGWRSALGCLGIAALAIATPVVLLGIVLRPESVGAFPDGADSPPGAEPASSGDESLASFFRDPRFWLVGSAFALMNGAGISFLTHGIPIALERGIEREQAVVLLTVNAIAAAGGKIVFGVLIDRLGVRTAAQLATSVQAIAWLGIVVAAQAAPFMAAAALFSFGLGCAIPCQAGFIGALYGRASFGRATGLMGLIGLTGALAVPPLIGAAYDASGSYALPLQTYAMVTLLPIVLFTLVRLQPAGPPKAVVSTP